MGTVFSPSVSADSIVDLNSSLIHNEHQIGQGCVHYKMAADVKTGDSRIESRTYRIRSASGVALTTRNHSRFIMNQPPIIMSQSTSSPVAYPSHLCRCSRECVGIRAYSYALPRVSSSLIGMSPTPPLLRPVLPIRPGAYNTRIIGSPPNASLPEKKSMPSPPYDMHRPRALHNGRVLHSQLCADLSQACHDICVRRS